MSQPRSRILTTIEHELRQEAQVRAALAHLPPDQIERAVRNGWLRSHTEQRRNAQLLASGFLDEAARVLYQPSEVES